jgi:hypothetical protein
MTLKLTTACLVLLGLAACGTLDTATRNAPATDPIETLAAAPAVAPAYAVAKLDVVVPEKLRVSEANVYYPLADIVWRGDAFGDRREQVKSLFTAAAAKADVKEGRPVNVGIELVRFHGLTEKARYVTGGVYAITFRLTLTDPKTGEIVEEPRIVEADLPAVGGYRAMLDDHKGRTERMIVTEHLIRTLRHELNQPAA